MDKIVFFFLSASVFVMPWEEYFSIPGFETGTRIFGALAFLFGAVTVLFTFSVRRPHRGFIPLIFFVLWTCAGMLWSIDRAETQVRSVTYLLLITFVWLIWQFADTLPRQQWLMRAFILGTAVAMGDLFLARLRGVNPFTGLKIERFSATGLNPNGMAIYVVIAMNFAFYLAARPGKKGVSFVKLACWGGFVVAATVTVFLTGSRSGFLALAASLAVTTLALLALFRMAWKPAAVLILGMGALYLIPRVVSETNIARVQEGTEAGTFQRRVTLWQESLQAWRERPILGIGAGSTSDIAENVSHNTFLSVLTENGLVGLAIYASFWALLGLAILSLQKAEKILWITMFIGYAPHMLSASAEYQKVLWFMFGLGLAQTISVASVKLRRGAGPIPLQTLRPNAV